MREKVEQKLSPLHYGQAIEVHEADDLVSCQEFQKRLIRNELNALVVHTRRASDVAAEWEGEEEPQS